MIARLKELWRTGVTAPRVFALLCVVSLLLLYFGKSAGLTGLAAIIVGAVLLLRIARKLIRQTIWRLRNRLVMTYVFIAVVPVVLILVLVGIGTYFVAGQVAVYLVQSELDRRIAALAGPAQFLLRAPESAYAGFTHEFRPMVGGHFPSLQLLITGERNFHYPESSAIAAPPGGWGDYNGMVVKDGAYYALAHVKAPASDVTVLAPVTLDFLSDLIPNLGDVRVLDLNRRAGQHMTPASHAGRVPPPVSRFDYAFTWVAPLTVANWAKPGENETHVMTITTRASAVLGTVFGQKLDVEEVVLVLFVSVLVLFSIVEIVALVIGVSLARSITGAVENLYQGTRRISEGDVSHRIRVKGTDQLAALGQSFNSMTEHLQRLIVVEKEKERLQSELEIAREVQNQLFPRSAPLLRNLELTGVCHPARMVSGDYYDYLCVQDSALAFAIGDVAGKGISAALLMASIQSIMRTQLSTGIHAAAASVGGPIRHQLHAAPLVAQLNKQLYENTAPEKYATFFFGIYEERLSTLTYTNAGHLPPVLLRGGEAILLNPTGTVVGAFPHCVYEEETIRLEPDDMLVAYTDGITEPENAYGEEFGLDRVLDLVRRHREETSPQIIAHVMQAVEHWTAAAELPDDMTLLIARRVG